MLTGALGTLAAALTVLAISAALGAGTLAACGWRRWSWTAPAIGLALATVLTWWAVRLPGHGWTALLVLAVATIAAGTIAATRLEGWRAAAREGAPVLALSLLGVAIPFVVEGHFGILGTGFNVDMSQHLFAADWIADPVGQAPGPFDQGYPLGPHALAVATAEITGNPVTAFSGITVALPVIAALTALAAVRSWPWWRATIVAALTAFAYLFASYLAQGAFKELFEVCFLLGFALWLRELGSAEAPAPALRTGVPGAVLGAGALYAYSAPGLAWLAATLGLWAVIVLASDRAGAAGSVKRALPAVAVGAVALLALAAPELDRIIDFGGSVGTVSDSAESSRQETGLLTAARGDSGVSGGGNGSKPSTDPEFDNDLGNLFGQISPLEAMGVWPSGDLRVAPGDGAIPAFAFYAGALLGVIALAISLLAAIRERESALLAALAAAAAIWVAARLGSTPYTAAKALALVAPIAMLIAARGVMHPDFTVGAEARVNLLRAAMAAAFVGAAGISSGLALANAPIGPERYTPGVRELSERFAGRSTLLLAPNEVIADQHGRDFYAWELREASPACVESSTTDTALPPGFRLVLTVDGTDEAPFAGLTRAAEAGEVVLWKVTEPDRGAELEVLGDGVCA